MSFKQSFVKHTTNLAGLPVARRAGRIVAWSFLAGLLFLNLSCASQFGGQHRSPDFSNYDVPLTEQIRNRIKAKILARLGDGRNASDRYFIIPFAYQNRANDPALSHSFLSVIRVLADDKKSNLTAGLEKQTYLNRDFQAFTISWLPHDFATNPNLCVFEGVGSRIFAAQNTCPLSVGRNFKLDETLALAVKAGNAVCMWGPYEISEAAFNLGVNRMRLLNEGTIKYRADDRLYRKDRVAINCFHAMAGLDKLYPNGGIFGTGFMMWGFNGTVRVLLEYKARAKAGGLLFESVDEKNDRYGFVYAPTRNADDIYDPFETASAYRK